MQTHSINVVSRARLWRNRPASWLFIEAELAQQLSAVEVSGSSIPQPDTSSDEEDEVSLPVNTRQIKMSISVDFLAPKPIQDGSDLSN